MSAVVSRPRGSSVDVRSIAGLLATGVLIGGSAPFMRAATQTGISPLPWLEMTTSIAGIRSVRTTSSKAFPCFVPTLVA